MQLKRNLLSVALASATLLLAAQAQAQDAAAPQAEPSTPQDAQELDTVVVTGIRRGIQDSIDTKQAEDTIVEAISAEDIGKLPDTSIADSIARLPGLTAQRFGGRPQEINIRGFAGDFSTTLLNGREQVSLGNNRGVEFDQYPSELMSQVVVHKTTDASLVGQGLSGTVDLRTVRPLSFSDRAVALNYRGDMNRRDDDKRYGNRFSLSYIDQFADNTVGIALGYARLNNPQQGHQFEAWGYDGDGRMSGGKLYDIQDDNERDGYMGVLEFKPNDEWHSTLDVFYSKFDKDQDKRGIEFGINNASGTADQFAFDNFRPVIRNDYNGQHDTLFAIGWRNEIRLGEQWTLTTDVSHSSGKRDERILETYAGLPDSMASATGNAVLNSDGFYDLDLSYDFDDPSVLVLTDAGGWGQDGYIKDFRVNDSLTATRVDLKRSFDSGFISELEFGANLTDRRKSRASNENFLCLAACNDQAEVAPPASMLGSSAFDFGGLDGVLGYDALDAYRELYNLRSNSNPDITRKNWSVNERVLTAYAQLGIDTQLGSLPLRGNVGVQAVNVEQSSIGGESFPGSPGGQPVEQGANYTNYLPSMNLSLGLPAEQFIRFGASRQAARPRMDEMRAGGDITVGRPDSNPFTGETNVQDPRVPIEQGTALTPFWYRSGGNAELKPWLANAYDLSYEKYFGGNKGYVSLAYFYKDLKTYIYEQTTISDIGDTSLLPDDYPALAPLDSRVVNRKFVNGEGGVLKGYEFAVSLPFELLWQPLQGLGFVGSYSATESAIRPLGPDQPDEPLPGLSKYVSNMTLYYERNGFSIRGSQRHRSKFRGEVQGFGGDRTKTDFNGESVYDFQVGYSFQSGPLENLSILLQLNNIKNEPFVSTFNDSGRVKQYYEYGRTYLLGLNYRF